MRLFGRAIVGCIAAFFCAPGSAQARAIDSLVFISNIAQVREAPRRQLDTTRVPMLSTPAARKTLKPFLGKEIDRQILARLQNAVQKYFAGTTHPYVSVTIPGQDASSGVLRVLVLESKLGRVRVTGNRWFDAAQYRDAVRIRPGTSIDNGALTSDVNWLNGNQYRHATVTAAEGLRYGTTDLTIHAQDRFPVSLNAGIDNSGNASTGLTRLSTGFDWGNAFFRGDDLNYEYETTPDGSTLQQHSMGYTFNFPTHSTLDVFGTYATTQVPNAAFMSTGLTETLSLRYTAPLHGSANFTQQVSGGTDYKSTNNNLLFGGVSVFPTITKIYDYAASYTPTLVDGWGSTTATLAVFLSPGGWGNSNSDAAFSSQQPGARARYTYANADVSRSIDLRGGFAWKIHVQTQISTSNLLPSEQLNFGYPSIRGFPSSFATRDEGVILSTQWSLRPFPLGVPQALRIARARDALTPYAFIDYGTGWNHQDLGASSYIRVLSVGPGFTYQLGPYITGRFDYGFALQHYGLPAPGGQADLGLQLHT